jgi:hypothetical protein
MSAIAALTPLAYSDLAGAQDRRLVDPGVSKMLSFEIDLI